MIVLRLSNILLWRRRKGLEGRLYLLRVCIRKKLEIRRIINWIRKGGRGRDSWNLRQKGRGIG